MFGGPAVSPRQYKGCLRALQVFPAVLAVCAAALGGCASVSLPLARAAQADAPATTGSIATPVEIRGRLPDSLAYSDLQKIGSAGAAALFQAEPAGEAKADWVNAKTGSSGTVAARTSGTAADGSCRPFETTVTSFGGVHHYSGVICRRSRAAVVEIDADPTTSAS